MIRPVLNNSSSASKTFTKKAWQRLPATVAPQLLKEIWGSDTLAQARNSLREIAIAPGVIIDAEMHTVIGPATAQLDPDIRELIREALRLYTYNCDLSQELSVLWSSGTDERRTIADFGWARSSARSSILHSDRPPSLTLRTRADVTGPGELPHYLLMRCVSEMKNGKGRSSLGSTLTGCYLTLLHSSKGRSLQKHIKSLPTSGVPF